MFHPKSPYHSVCADVMLVNPVGVVAPHSHQIIPKVEEVKEVKIIPMGNASSLKPISIGRNK